MSEQNDPQIPVSDVQGFLNELGSHIFACHELERKYYDALEFAKDHIKSGKPCDEECERVIGKALLDRPLVTMREVEEHRRKVAKSFDSNIPLLGGCTMLIAAVPE